jgi:uncharacterized repeat protein (TIGR01451 family)
MAALQGQALWPEKSASPDVYTSGDEITYTLEVGHSAVESPANDIVLMDVLPENTTFLNATQPYSFDGTTVRWEFEHLEPVDSRTVEMTVRVPLDFFGIITNGDYQVVSAEVTPPVEGEPVLVEVLPRYQLLIPWIITDR